VEYTPSNLQPFFQQLNMAYQTGYRAAPTMFEQIATTIPSGTEMNVYGWMDLLGSKMRQWLGERYVRNIVSRGYVLTNLLFELTAEVPRTKIEDDQYGLYGQKLNMIGRQAKIWPDDQCFTALINGGAATSLAYDGLPYFSSSHPIDPSGETIPTSTVQSNDLGLALTGANFATALATGKAYKGRDNAPLGTFALGKPLLVVGPTLEKTARDLISANFFSPTATYGAAAANAPSENTYMGAADLLVTPWITSATAWYLIDRSFGLMPIVWQLRKAPEIQTRTADTDEPVFTRDALQWGVRARGVAGYTLPFLAIRGNS
jgi:phage major head subunit gpT-like protein